MIIIKQNCLYKILVGNEEKIIACDSPVELYEYVAKNYGLAGRPFRSITELYISGATHSYHNMVPGPEYDLILERAIQEAEKNAAFVWNKVKITTVSCSTLQECRKKTFYMRQDNKEGQGFRKKAISELYGKIEAYLSTPEGWAMNCKAGYNFTWRDLLDGCLSNVPGLSFEAPVGVTLFYELDLTVAEEKLAPKRVKGEYHGVKMPDAGDLIFPCEVDFTNGRITTLENIDPNCEQISSAYVVANGNAFPCECNRWWKLAAPGKA